MKHLIFIIAALSLSFVSQAQRPAQGPVSDKKYTPEALGYYLFWEDEFNGNKLDTTKWKVRGKGPRAIAYVSEEAVKVEDG